MNNLSNYLTYLNEGLILKKDCYCYILKYKEFGFEKIFYVGQKDLPFYGKSLFGFNLCFPVTKENWKDFLNGEEIDVPFFYNSMFNQKFNKRRISKIITSLEVLDKGMVDLNYNFNIFIPSFFNFRGMTTFKQKTKIIFEEDPNSKIVHLHLKK